MPRFASQLNAKHGNGKEWRGMGIMTTTNSTIDSFKEKYYKERMQNEQLLKELQNLEEEASHLILENGNLKHKIEQLQKDTEASRRSQISVDAHQQLA